MYNYADPTNPIKYALNQGNHMHYGNMINNPTMVKMERSVIMDIDGRIRTFWNAKITHFSPVAFQVFPGFPISLESTLKQNYYKYNQYYAYGKATGVRRLSSSEVKSSIKSKEEESNNNVIFYMFYIMSQLGGLYAFLTLILGFIIQPIILRMFRK
mmetsp:Transcript_26296/g.23261  ORF Transcript_26296/g.23261 Transcript_26296/m.23261 type:complete len:156 (+) Transcript_26296:102-569(+)